MIVVLKIQQSNLIKSPLLLLLDDKTIRTQYPLWNAAKGKVIGLEQALLDCRVKNGEKKIGSGKGKLAWISAFICHAIQESV
jgi:hypothetical protein